MPFKSEKQRRFMWARHPGIAARWTREFGSKVVPSRKKEFEDGHGKGSSGNG
jgi:hypothetical protein